MVKRFRLCGCYHGSVGLWDSEVVEPRCHQNTGNRMRGTMNRSVQALYLSAGFGDFGDYHDALSYIGGRVGYALWCFWGGSGDKQTIGIKEGLYG